MSRPHGGYRLGHRLSLVRLWKGMLIALAGLVGIRIPEPAPANQSSPPPAAAAAGRRKNAGHEATTTLDIGGVI